MVKIKMEMKRTAMCSECGKSNIRYRHTYKVGNRRLCKKCYEENRHERRKKIIPKIKPAPKKEKPVNAPLIKKDKKRSVRVSISPQESKVLFTQLVRSGLSQSEAKKRIKQLKSHEKNLLLQIRQEIDNKKELNKKFKDSFKSLK